MAGSPFHGIFRTQGNTGDARRLFSFDDEKQKSAEAAPAPAQDSVGRLAVDIYEAQGSYVIVAPIAGARLADLDIDTNGNAITIRGRRQKAEAVHADQYYLQECFWGMFERKVTLPIQIDPKKVKATFNKDCILRITIPKEPKVSIVQVEQE